MTERFPNAHLTNADGLALLLPGSVDPELEPCFSCKRTGHHEQRACGCVWIHHDDGRGPRDVCVDHRQCVHEAS